MERVTEDWQNQCSEAHGLDFRGTDWQPYGHSLVERGDDDAG